MIVRLNDIQCTISRLESLTVVNIESCCSIILWEQTKFTYLHVFTLDGGYQTKEAA